jgi:Tol biopolymer transport system component/DNA-binding winged helix-turn-helix (wHTH) protein
MHNPSRRVRFGPFQLDVRSGELRKGRMKLKVPDQSIEILKALLEQPGELVTREQLRERLWPADTFVDFEHGLNTAVRRLRAALGEAADTPRYIETLPRRGYRFIGVLEPAASDEPAPPQTPSEIGHPPTPAALPVVIEPPPSLERPQATAPVRRLAAARAVAAVAVPLLIALVWLAASWRTHVPDAEVTEVPFTSFEGDELAGRFSPDGREVVFTWAKPDAPADIYLKMVGSETVRPFVTTPDHEEVGPVFSPDGRSIAFLRLGPYASTVIVKPRDGGPERPVTEISNPHRTFIGSPGPYLAWTSDGQALIYPDRKALHAWRLDGSGSLPLTVPPPTAARGDADPALSPDGRTLVFVRDATTGAADLYRLALDDRFAPVGSPELLFSNGSWNRSPAWSPDGSRIVFVSGPWGRQRLWSLDVRKPASARAVPGVSLDAHQPAVSSSGDVLYTRWFFRRGIWTLPLAGAAQAAGPPQPLLTSMRYDGLPRISRDGSHIVFASDRTGSFEVWTAGIDGSDPRKVTSFDGPPAGCPDVSPDGKQVVFDHLFEGQRDVFISDLFGANLRRLTTDPFDDVCPRWSADGTAVYFASMRDGSQQIWRLHLDSGGLTRMTSDGAMMVEESSDGATLYFTQHDGRSPPLLAVPTQGGAARQVIEAVSHRQMSVTREGIYYVPAQAVGDIWFLDVATGETRFVAAMSGRLVGPIAVHPEHRLLLGEALGPPPGDLILVRGLRLP